MTDDSRDRMPETPLSRDTEASRGSSSNILDALDALDMAEVGEIDIVFERPLSHPRSATFD